MVKDSARGGRLVLLPPSAALGRGEGVWGRLRKTHSCKTLLHPKISITTLMLHWDPWGERKGERREGEERKRESCSSPTLQNGHNHTKVLVEVELGTRP